MQVNFNVKHTLKSTVFCKWFEVLCCPPLFGKCKKKKIILPYLLPHSSCVVINNGAVRGAEVAHVALFFFHLSPTFLLVPSWTYDIIYNHIPCLPTKFMPLYSIKVILTEMARRLNIERMRVVFNGWLLSCRRMNRGQSPGGEWIMVWLQHLGEGDRTDDWTKRVNQSEWWGLVSEP